MGVKAGWIDASERRPREDGQAVIAHGVDGRVREVWYAAGKFWDDGGWREASVTHWMPLPGPPDDRAEDE